MADQTESDVDNDDDDDDDDDDGLFEAGALPHGDPRNLERARFVNALGRCGIHDQRTLDYLNVYQGITNIDDLVSLNLSDIEKMVVTTNKTAANRGRGATIRTLIITALSEKKLKALREWVKWRQAMNSPITPIHFTDEALKWSLERMDFEKRQKTADEPDAPKPEKLKTIGHKTWIPFWRQFKNYCDTLRGNLNIPISYVLRDQEEPEPNLYSAQYISSDQALMACVSLEGQAFREDNARIWMLIESLTCNGNIWPFIRHMKNTQNGREAIRLIRAQCEGAAADETRKKNAYNILSNSVFEGKGRFTWDSYVENLQFAFSELNECGDPQSESHQIHVLTSNCRHNDLKFAVEMVLGDPIRFPTFLLVIEHWKGFIVRALGTKPAQDRRNVSSTTSSGNYKGLKDKYTNEEWKTLPQDTKDLVMQRNKERKSSGASGPSSGGTNLKSKNRRIKKLETKLAKYKTDSNTVDEAEDAASDTTPPAKPNSTTKRSKKS